MNNTVTITVATTNNDSNSNSNADAAKVVNNPSSSHHRVKFIEGEYISEYLMLNNFGRDIMDKYPPLVSFHQFSHDGDRLTKADADLIIKRLSKVCTLSYKRKPYSGRKRWYFYVKKVVDSTLLDNKGRLKSNTLYIPISPINTEDNHVTNVTNVTNNNNPGNSNSEPDITTHTQPHINYSINQQNRKKYLSIILLNNLVELFDESVRKSLKGNNTDLLIRGRVVRDSNNQPWVTMTTLEIMSFVIDGHLLNTPRSQLYSFLRPYINKFNRDIRDIIDNDNNIINLFNLEMGTNIHKIYRKTYGVYELSNDSSDSDDDEGSSFEYVYSMRILEEDYLDSAERRLCSLYQKHFHRQLKGSSRYRYFDYFCKVSLWGGADREVNADNKPVYTPIKDFVLEGSQLLGIGKKEHICALHSLDFMYKDKLVEFLSRYDITQIINDYRGYMRHTLIEYVNKKLTEKYHITNDTNMYKLLGEYTHNNTFKQLSQKQMIDYVANFNLQIGYVPVVFSKALDQRIKDIKELLLIEQQCVQEMENLYNYHQKLVTFMGNIDTIIVPNTDDSGT